MENMNEEKCIEGNSEETNPPVIYKKQGLVHLKVEPVELEFHKLANKIQDLKKCQSQNWVEFCKTIYQAKETCKEDTKWNFEKFIKDKRVNLKKTQTTKCLDVGEYLSTLDDVQSTELFYKLGIEKTYLLAQIKDIAARQWLADYIIKHGLSVSHIKKILKYFTIKSKDNIRNAAYQVAQMQKKIISWDEEVFPRKKERIDYKYEYSSVVKSFTELFDRYKLLKEEKGETVEQWILHSVNFHTAIVNSDKEEKEELTEQSSQNTADVATDEVNSENVHIANVQSAEIKIEFADKQSEYPEIVPTTSTQEQNNDLNNSNSEQVDEVDTLTPNEPCEMVSVGENNATSDEIVPEQNTLSEPMPIENNQVIPTDIEQSDQHIT